MLTTRCAYSEHEQSRTWVIHIMSLSLSLIHIQMCIRDRSYVKLTSVYLYHMFTSVSLDSLITKQVWYYKQFTEHPYGISKQFATNLHSNSSKNILLLTTSECNNGDSACISKEFPDAISILCIHTCTVPVSYTHLDVYKRQH